MDFIVGLLSSKGFTAIFVVVDRLTKIAHFMPLKTGFTAKIVATVFLDYVVKLHGFPQGIVLDRDPIFLSAFW
uniref:Retrotransposable element Tf2 n=1 Tax=Cajanus cajan TaxID=3821 RepID=A0A151T8J0_CAJCA|nr:Retrotransposable element Tf2 [Cajanus cajan]